MREGDVARRIDARLDDWEARLDRLDDVPAQARRRPRAASNAGHVVFIPSPAGYVLLERAGEPPPPGERVELEEGEGWYAVTRVVGSPVPGDERSWAYLEPI